MIMVGTMYSGEGDFEKCCESVASQNCKCDHKIISGLHEVAAHERLYRIFKEGNYDFLIKLDADTVMTSNDIVSRMVDEASRQKWDRLSGYVTDFYTTHRMSAIHCYSKKVSWDWSKFVNGNMKPDRADNVRRKSSLSGVVGLHCYYASERQSFHFGFHRCKKGQMDRVSQILDHFLVNNHPNLKSACLGAAAAIESAQDYIGYTSEFDRLFDASRNREFTFEDAKKLMQAIRGAT